LNRWRSTRIAQMKTKEVATFRAPVAVSRHLWTLTRFLGFFAKLRLGKKNLRQVGQMPWE